MIRGWRYGRERVDEKQIHHLLIPYSQLPESEKIHDRYTIIGKPSPQDSKLEQFGYVDIVKTVGLRVSECRC